MEKVEGKVAFVTGGASGIGLGLAKVLVKAGMKVVIADIRQDHIDEATAFFTEAGQSTRVLAIRLDVTDREAYARAADEAEKTFKKIHLLANNAGVGILGELKQARWDDWDWGLGVNIGGVVNGIQTLLPRMLAHGEGGHIVNTSSMAAVLPIPRTAIYTTAKAAIVALSEVMHAELAADNIGVSAFCPGPVATNIQEAGKLRPEKYRRDSGYAEFEQQLEKRPNSPLWMDPGECGERILRGIRRNDLFIFTHREFKEGVEERFQATLASFPDEPVNKPRADAIPFLTSNPMYKEVLKSLS